MAVVEAVAEAAEERAQGGERAQVAERALAADIGLRPEVVEPFTGRGSVGTRLRGDGTGGGPLLLLSHIDVVPAPAEGWTHGPFDADLADGYVWGRGAVDMKGTAAMQLVYSARTLDDVIYRHELTTLADGGHRAVTLTPTRGTSPQ